MSHRRILTSLAGLAAAALAVPSFAAPSLADAVPAPAPAATSPSTSTTRAAYTGSPQDAAATKAFYDAVVKSAHAKMAQNAKAGKKVAAVTVTYAVDAPTFRSQINSSTSIWNSSVSNVRLVEGSNYDFYYTEGNDPRGSYASPTGTGAATSSWTTPSRSSTTRPGSPPTRPVTYSACRTTTPAPAPS